MFSFLSHTADVAVHVEARSTEELFHDAMRGMYALAECCAEHDGHTEVVLLQCREDSIESLLVAFLEELLYYLFYKSLYTISARIYIKDNTLRAECVMGTASVQRTLKAVTFHMLRIREEKRSFSVDIVFDV